MPSFPATILPSDIVAWMDGTQLQFIDLGATTPASPGNLIRRVSQASPLTDYWRSTTDAQRPRKPTLSTAQSVRFDAFGSTNPGAELDLGSIPSLTAINNATIVVMFLCRDGYGGPNMGLCAAGSPNWGVFTGSSGAGAYVNGGPWQAFGVNTVTRGQKTTIGVRYGSTQVRASLYANGTTQTATNTTTVTGGTLGAPLNLAWAGSACQGLYGEIGQALVINRQISDTEMTQLLARCDSLTLPDAFPTSQPLIGIVGDSIARSGVGTSISQSWWGQMLQTVRSGIAPGAECCNCAIVGSGISSGSLTPYTFELQGFKSAARAQQVAVVAIGTNDIANGATAAATLSGLYGLCDAMRADGWRVVLQNILPRAGLFNLPGTLAYFQATQPIVNADIAANWKKHADAFVDVASISGLNDPTNTTYYQGDLVHPTAAGQAAMAGPITAAVVNLLSPQAATAPVYSVVQFSGGTTGAAQAISYVSSMYASRVSSVVVAVMSGGSGTRIVASDLGTLTTGLNAAAQSATAIIVASQ